ncbi:hypothetical protein [Shewanella algae]|uniref:hypothetical protein n=1 Tax=Shewanella algae TaxID=38313 RepID=UPI0031F522ED
MAANRQEEPHPMYLLTLPQGDTPPNIQAGASLALLPPGEYRLYFMALFAHSQAALQQKAHAFQQLRGFAWWQTDTLRLLDAVSQDKFHLPVRPPNGYWRQTPLPASQWQRKQLFSTNALNAMTATPEPLTNALASFRRSWDSARQTHERTLKQPPQQGELWGRKASGSPAMLQQTITQWVLPPYSHAIACCLVSPEPLEEYEQLCQ